MYCKYCGVRVPDDALFCPDCGKQISKQNMEDDLNELVVKAKTGDQDAISMLYEKSYSKVFYTVRSMIRDEDDALDIV